MFTQCLLKSKLHLTQGCAPYAEVIPQYYQVPLIGCHGETFTRLRRKRKIESWLENDHNQIVRLIQMHAGLWEEEILVFQDELAGVLGKMCPGSEIVETGSSGRDTSVFPLSDIDIVCIIPLQDSADLRRLLPALKRNLGVELKKNYPSWQMDGKHIAVEIFKIISGSHHALANVRIFADVLLGFAWDSLTRGIHSGNGNFSS